MKITILGCGGSSGVPLIGCDCPVCKSPDAKNKRLRASILVEEKNTAVLVDSSPDLRQQALNNNISKIDAVLFTHAHADHVGGLDDLRAFSHISNKPLPVYSDRKTLEELKTRFDYAFIPEVPKSWYRPCLIPHEIKGGKKFTIGDMAIEPFVQGHGKITTLGFRFGDFAYSTDTDFLPKETLENLRGVKVWVVDCLRYEKAPTHSHLNQTLQWIKSVRPKTAILTHMGHEMDYQTLKENLPEGIEPAYDGMTVEITDQ